MVRQFLMGTSLIISFSCAFISSASFHTAEFSSTLDRNEEVIEEFHRTFPLAANGVVSLENFAGTVRIKTWEQNEIKIDAVKRAYQKERLVEADIIIDHKPDVFRIKTRYANENLSWSDDESRRYNNPASVSYTLTVPRNVRLDKIELLNGAAEIEGVVGGIKASSVNAGFTLRSIAGSVDISTVNGRLEAILEPKNQASSVSLSSVNGQIILTVAPDANVQFKAHTMNGEIKNDFGLKVNHTVGSYLTGILGGGSAQIDLSNVNGSIILRRMIAMKKQMFREQKLTKS
ncbi:MAG: DUF4097 domain-containing protein [Pyrinomonadaceae bacterium]